jgi:hypothetical protein
MICIDFSDYNLALPNMDFFYSVPGTDLFDISDMSSSLSRTLKMVERDHEFLGENNSRLGTSTGYSSMDIDFGKKIIGSEDLVDDFTSFFPWLNSAKFGIPLLFAPPALTCLGAEMPFPSIQIYATRLSASLLYLSLNSRLLPSANHSLSDL